VLAPFRGVMGMVMVISGEHGARNLAEASLTLPPTRKVPRTIASAGA